jgi:DNA phosphorothioation-associated putative methyltransferase
VNEPLAKAVLGKKVFSDTYVHIDYIKQCFEGDVLTTIQKLIDKLQPEEKEVVNVIKYNQVTGKVSCLNYLDFEGDPFPVLGNSFIFDISEGKFTKRNYLNSLNPPILHRKELLVDQLHTNYDKWTEVTNVATDIGLFDTNISIGFKQNWVKLIESKGYRLNGSDFIPIGNDESTQLIDGDSAKGEGIKRHLTALSRTALSAPVQQLIRFGLLSSTTTFFDYGCGRGSDIEALKLFGISSKGWDPHYAPENEIVNASVVNLGFVINVIEDPVERIEAVSKAFSLANGVMAISVMLYGNGNSGKPFRDGFITSRNTFQKYFTQSEFKAYLEDILHQEIFMVSPGVALVFRDKELEQRFNLRRYRSNRFAERLLSAKVGSIFTNKPRKEKPIKVRRFTKGEEQLQNARPLLDDLWRLTLDLGRFPEAIEVINLSELLTKTGTFSRAIRLLRLHYDQSLLEKASSVRAGEVSLYMADQLFSKRKPYRKLEPRLQRDIKYFYRDYKTAQNAGLQLLKDASDPDKILQACEAAAAEGIGYIDSNHSLQLHISLIERLPIILRAYVTCGLILWDAVNEVQLVKIHIGSGKLSLMEYEGFDTSPIPVLKKRIKINILRQDYDVYEYDTPKFPPTVLYFKSLYMSEEMEAYAEQQQFDEAIENFGIAKVGDFGLSYEELHLVLNNRRLEIDGFSLIRSRKLPNLDDLCGQHLTYRDLIECGQTRRSLGLANLPLQSKTYNALYDLATELLDPVIDYFGSIQLTYGFCSNLLRNEVKANIDPKLDQHCSYELNRTGKLICDRGGAACDFFVEDEDMLEVAKWIVENLPFDRIYIYGSDRPLHVSFGPQNTKQIVIMRKNENTNTRVPRVIKIQDFQAFKWKN